MILSILLPYWGDVNYMKLAVMSVLEQTDRNWCMYILDDDYPGNAIEDFVNSLSDSRITYSRNPLNLGANGNFRKALEMIETPYFMMLGADDILAANYVETIINQILTNPEVSIFQPGVDVINDEGHAVKTLVDSVKKMIRPQDGVHSGSKLAARLMLGNFAYFPSITWKTDDVRAIGFRHNYNVTQDLALICDLLLTNGKMLIISDRVFLYRRHGESDSSLKLLTGARFSEEIELCTEMSAKFRENRWYLAYIAAFVRPSVRVHMLLLSPRVILKPKIFKQLLKGALL